MLPCFVSQDIVKYLHEIKGFSLDEIADITSASIKEIELILKGSQTFSVENIKSLIKKQDTSIIAILSEACPEKHLPENLRKNVSFYKHIQEVKRKNKNKR